MISANPAVIPANNGPNKTADKAVGIKVNPIRMIGVCMDKKRVKITSNAIKRPANTIFLTFIV
ncbi:hypothetical protein SB48_HM08orf01574 [Heyndrickxia coagulans]|uniref:Uncharacterized protein n=1 Tax=Heyndrickxia coagulans TaxID=1398 RepID=A0AAN0WB07_HEYCO|nr:hypothetical protein SB48_HM08orf01574 [Heyndrickxia coagulans]